MLPSRFLHVIDVWIITGKRQGIHLPRLVRKIGSAPTTFSIISILSTTSYERLTKALARLVEAPTMCLAEALNWHAQD